MAGYAPFTLDTVQSERVARYAPFFRALVSQLVTVEFTKRDGTARTLIGTVEEVKFSTDASHAAVVISTAEGFRSANLYAIHDARQGE